MEGLRNDEKRREGMAYLGFYSETIRDVDRTIHYGLVSGYKLIYVIPITFVKIDFNNYVATRFRVMWDRRKKK